MVYIKELTEPPAPLRRLVESGNMSNGVAIGGRDIDGCEYRKRQLLSVYTEKNILVPGIPPSGGLRTYTMYPEVIHTPCGMFYYYGGPYY